MTGENQEKEQEKAEQKLKITSEIPIIKVKNGKLEYVQDVVSVEKPVEIWLNGNLQAVLYASPQHLKELAVGFLVAKRISNCKAITKVGMSVMGMEPLETYAVKVEAKKMANSVGFMKDTYPLKAVKQQDLENYLSIYDLHSQDICKVMASFVGKSQVFKETGGVHSAAIAQGGECQFFAEDVARYNAYNKAIGYYVLNPDLENARYLLISGRVSGEMIEESMAAGISLIISKSAPLERAVILAKQYKVGLIGFVRGESFNIYNL